MPSLETLVQQVEEVSQRYAERHGLKRDDVWFSLKRQEELGERTHAYVRFSGRDRAEMVGIPGRVTCQESTLQAWKFR